ncbi:MAG: ATP-binding protein, partial [Anaerohalosphaeraceae bacterium]
IRDLLDMTAVKKGIELCIEKAPSAPEVFFSDPMRLRQCLLNLLSNAIKFTERGRVHLNVAIIEDSGRKRICFMVEDTGIGIPVDKQKTLFESFVQADSKMDRKYGGTGLGLAITKRLCSLLGGYVQLQSQPGKGSVFKIVLPFSSSREEMLDSIQQNRQDNSVKEPPVKASQIKMLVIEDKSPSQLAMNLMLRRQGIDVRVIPSEPQRIQRALEDKPDLIMLDMEITGLDPIELVQSFQRQGVTAPVIAVTEDGTEVARVQFKAAGCKECLVKPITRVELFHTVQNYTTRRNSHSRRSDKMDTVVPDMPHEISVEIKLLLKKLPELLRVIPELLTQSNGQTLRRVAHLLAEIGSAASVACLTDKATLLETLIDADVQDRQRIEQITDEIKAICKDLEARNSIEVPNVPRV